MPEVKIPIICKQLLHVFMAIYPKRVFPFLRIFGVWTNSGSAKFNEIPRLPKNEGKNEPRFQVTVKWRNEVFTGEILMNIVARRKHQRSITCEMPLINKIKWKSDKPNCPKQIINVTFALDFIFWRNFTVAFFIEDLIHFLLRSCERNFVSFLDVDAIDFWFRWSVSSRSTCARLKSERSNQATNGTKKNILMNIQQAKISQFNEKRNYYLFFCFVFSKRNSVDTNVSLGLLTDWLPWTCTWIFFCLVFHSLSIT